MSGASDRKIAESIARMARTYGRDIPGYMACVVDTVNINSRTCDCTAIGGDAPVEIPNVLLMAETDDGILYVPKIGSTIIVCHSTKNEPYVALFSALDKAYLITDNGVQLQDGTFGGLVKVETVQQKLNNLENMINDLASKFNAHTHILTLTAGTGSAAPTTDQETTTLTPTERSELENTKITHGS